MVFESADFRRVDGSTGANTFWRYNTNDAAAVVEAAGYFNDAVLAHNLTVGALVAASIDVDGTPGARLYVVATTPDGGDVTITKQA